jgi:hypothetical protein
MDNTQNQSGTLESMLGGGAAPGNNAAAAPAAAGGSAGGDVTPAQGTGAAAWTSQLSKELREGEAFEKIAGFKNISELVKAFLEKGASGAGGEDFGAVMEKFGAPKEGEAYGFEGELDGDLKDFLQKAKGAKLAPQQAKAVVDGYRELVTKRTESFMQQAVEKAPEISKALVDEFGAEAAAYYRKAVEASKLNVRLAQAGLGADKNLARALTLLGREMSEDWTPAAGGRPGQKPQSVREGATFNYSK